MRILLLMLCLTGLVAAQTTDWASFGPADRSFVARFPKMPQTVQKGPPTWLWADSSGPVYMLGYYQVPPDELAQGKPLFDGFVKAMMEGTRVQETSRQPYSAPNSIGYDIQGNKEGQPVHARVFLRNGQARFYFQMTVGKADFQRYFDGLTFETP